MTILRREVFQEWKANPLTVEFLSLLRQRHQDLKDRWGEGAALTEAQQAQAVVLGQLAGIRFSASDIREGGPMVATIEDLAGIEVSE